MEKLRSIANSRWFPFLVLILASALVYLPRINHLTYYRDDWYYMYDGHAAGPSVFNEMFKEDRPFRGPFFGLYFSLFGTNPLPYALGTYFWHLGAAFGALWFLDILWPRRPLPNLLGALLFLLYPGYLWWVAGIEYQPMMASLCLEVFSIVFSLNAITAKTKNRRFIYVILAILTGWYYLLLVDYAIGMEVFRFLSIYLLSFRDGLRLSVRKVIQTLRLGWINLLIPLGYLFWRVFLFQNERKATDIGTQMGQLLSSPLTTGLHWLIRWLQSTFNVALAAWIQPFNQNFFNLRLQSLLIGLVLAALLAAIIVLTYLALSKGSSDSRDVSDDTHVWPHQFLWLGGIGTVFGVLPVVLANRFVVFERFSHYALPASLAGSIFILGLIFLMSSSTIRIGALSLVVALAALTHFSIADKAISEEQIIQNFWWQASWRIPDIKEGTTLAVNYPSVEYGEDYEIVSGPANWIYHPEITSQVPVPYHIASVSLTPNDILNVVVGKFSADRTVRSHYFTIDYGNVLVMSQPTGDSCVHVLDARWPDLSISENEAFLLIAPESKIENVLVNAKAPVVPESVFGHEPEHGWCYFYQKADLARQQGNWDEIARLGGQAAKLELHPNDQIEWMPFLQAYAALDNKEQVKQISTRINTQTFYKQQACRNLHRMVEQGFRLSADMQSYVDELFCGAAVNE